MKVYKEKGRIGDVTSVIGYAPYVSTSRDENNIPELEACISQTSTSVKKQNNEKIIESTTLKI